MTNICSSTLIQVLPYLYSKNVEIIWESDIPYLNLTGIPTQKIYTIPPLFFQKGMRINKNSLITKINEGPSVLFLIVRAGQAIIAHIMNHNVVAYKVLNRYMVRKSQGKSQLSYLKQKGKSRLGSRIRLQQTKKFFLDINHCLDGFLRQVNPPIEDIFLSCTPILKGYWWQHHPPSTIKKEDPRWRRIPFHCNQPSRDGLEMIYKKMTYFKVLDGLDIP